jgi:hypothetical protein
MRYVADVCTGILHGIGESVDTTIAGYLKGLKIVDSCDTYAHFKAAQRYVDNLRKKSIPKLHPLCDHLQVTLHSKRFLHEFEE